MERNELAPETERQAFVCDVEAMGQLKVSNVSEMNRKTTNHKATETSCKCLGHPSSRESSRCNSQMKVAVINIDKIPDSPTGFIGRGTNRSMGQPNCTCSNLGKSRRLPPFERQRLQANVTTATSLVVEAMKTQINQLVISPFKHSTSAQLHHPCFSPGDELKLEILSEVQQMKKLMNDKKPSHCNSLEKGRLLKARLKPLFPVVDEGPSIAQCRGILPEIANCNCNPRICINTPYIDSAKEMLMRLYRMPLCSLQKKSETTNPKSSEEVPCSLSEIHLL